MRWAFCTIVLVPRGAWGALPTADERRRVFDWAAAAGFEGIELSPRWLDFYQQTPREWREIRAQIESAGLLVCALNISRCVLTRTVMAPEHRERLERGVDAAAEMGAGILGLSLSMPDPPTPERPLVTGDAFSDDEFEQAAVFVARLAERARAGGVALSVEMHDDGLLDTPERCLRFWERVTAAGGGETTGSVGLNPDLGNLCRGPGAMPKWESALRRLAPRTNFWHVKNYREEIAVPLWEGVIDYCRAVPILRAAGYEGWVGIESYFGDRADNLDLQKRSLSYLKEIAEKGAEGGASA